MSIANISEGLHYGGNVDCAVLCWVCKFLTMNLSDAFEGSTERGSTVGSSYLTSGGRWGGECIRWKS